MKYHTDAGYMAGKFLLKVRTVITSHTEPGFRCGYQNSPCFAKIVEQPFYDREKRIRPGLDPVEG